MPNLVEQQAIWVAKTYLKKRRYSVEDVSKNHQHKGYDLLARKGRKKLKIEVKGCSRPWGIPDPYVTEFSKRKRLVADQLIHHDGRQRCAAGADEPQGLRDIGLAAASASQ